MPPRWKGIRRHIALLLLAAIIAALASALHLAPGAIVFARQADGARQLISKIETALGAGSRNDFLALSTVDTSDPNVAAFLDRWFTPKTTRAVMAERDRETLPDGGLRIVFEVLTESGISGRLGTWIIEIGQTSDGWRVRKASATSPVEGLYRLQLDRTKQFHAKDLVVRAEDLELRLPAGEVFVAEAGGRYTALVLVGRGEMIFHPAPETERRQVALYCGHEELRTMFQTAFVRMSPGDADSTLPADHLIAAPVEPSVFDRAREVFNEQVSKSFSVDLADLSRESWSLLPTTGDFLAEIATAKLGILTYAHASNDAEDISLFDRAHKRNISVYTSAARLATRGPHYNEDDSSEYDVQDYQVDNSFQPERDWMEGETKLTVRIRAYALSALTIRLAEPLVVQSVSSDLFGRLLALRVRGQNSIVVNLPVPVNHGDVLVMTVRYAGRLEPQGVERENIRVQSVIQNNNIASAVLQPEPNYVYSNHAAWYAQGQVSDYATARIRLAVPPAFGAACSGEPANGSPVNLKPTVEGGSPRKLFVYVANAPVRYLACVVSRFAASDSMDVPLPPELVKHMKPANPAARAALPVRALSTVRVRGHARETMARAGDIATYYATVLDDLPYPSLTVAAVESQIPGGHAPGYLAILNQPLPTTPFVWRDDPAAFDDYPDFFIAHEVAHQWWGQAVGWENYHEQWLSEGLAQYFAVLYAEHQRGPQVFQSLLRQMTRWADDTSSLGPVYLGYRLAYLKGGGRTFRALVYNKGAVVMHMLRRMLGDEVFFRGLRRFYDEHRFQKAGTDDLRVAFEKESGKDLQRYFDRWIYGQDLPSLTASWKVAEDGRSVVATFAQPTGRVFDFPVTATVEYGDGSSEDHLVVVRDATTTASWPLKGKLKKISINRDRLTPLT
jgi:hypothetical protein